MTGLETAEYLLARGAEVTVLEMLPNPGRGIFTFNVTKALDALEEQGAEICTGTRVDAFAEGSVAVTDVETGVERDIPCDAAVLAIGVYTDHALRNLLEARFERVVEVGDANCAGKIMAATRDGWDRVKVL